MCAREGHRTQLSPIILRISLGEALPLLRQIIQRKNSRDWAHWDTGSAVDTLDRINVEHLLGGVRLFILLRVNAIYGTGVHACCVFCPNAGFCDYVCHKVQYLPGVSDA